MNEYQKKAHHKEWLWYHMFWNPKTHFTARIWVMNIIDGANAFLFKIWFDKLRGFHREEHWAYSHESFTTSYEMHVWMTWQFYEGWWPYILEGYVSIGGKLMTDWPSWWVLAWCTQLIKEQFSEELGDKILHDKSSNTTLGGMVKLDKHECNNRHGQLRLCTYNWVEG